MRYLLALSLTLACAASETQAPPLQAVPAQSASQGAAVAPLASTGAPSTAPTTKPTGKPTVIATLIDGERPIIPCGRMAFIGVYLYEIEAVKEGEPISGEIVVDVLCPDFYLEKITFKKGQRHLLTLEGAQKTYAGAVAPKPPREGLLRYSAKSIKPAP